MARDQLPVAPIDVVGTPKADAAATSAGSAGGLDTFSLVPHSLDRTERKRVKVGQPAAQPLAQTVCYGGESRDLSDQPIGAEPRGMLGEIDFASTERDRIASKRYAVPIQMNPGGDSDKVGVWPKIGTVAGATAGARRERHLPPLDRVSWRRDPSEVTCTRPHGLVRNS